MKLNFKSISSFLLCLFLMTCLISACQKTEPVEILYIPQINFVGISPETVTEFESTVTITIAYQDGTGDIGFENPDSPVVFVKDSRLAGEDGFHIPPLAPLNSNVPIQGNLDVVLKNTFILGNGDEETTNYEVYLIDRAGNKSNTIKTPDITIVRKE